MNLYKRLIPKNKAAIKEYGERYPYTANMIIAELKSEEFFTKRKVRNCLRRTKNM